VKTVHTLHAERAPGVPPRAGEASVWRLTTVPAARGRGVGRALMAAAEAWAAAEGAHHVSLITGNAESKAFYRRIGYAPETLDRAAAVVFGSPAPTVPWWNVRRWLQARMLARRCGSRTTIFARALEVAPAPVPGAGATPEAQAPHSSGSGGKSGPRVRRQA
jgi:hypothetical protein